MASRSSKNPEPRDNRKNDPQNQRDKNTYNQRPPRDFNEPLNHINREANKDRGGAPYLIAGFNKRSVPYLNCYIGGSNSRSPRCFSISNEESWDSDAPPDDSSSEENRDSSHSGEETQNPEAIPEPDSSNKEGGSGRKADPPPLDLASNEENLSPDPDNKEGRNSEPFPDFDSGSNPSGDMPDSKPTETSVEGQPPSQPTMKGKQNHNGWGEIDTGVVCLMEHKGIAFETIAEIIDRKVEEVKERFEQFKSAAEKKGGSPEKGAEKLAEYAQAFLEDLQAWSRENFPKADFKEGEELDADYKPKEAEVAKNSKAGASATKDKEKEKEKKPEQTGKKDKGKGKAKATNADKPDNAENAENADNTNNNTANPSSGDPPPNNPEGTANPYNMSAYHYDLLRSWEEAYTDTKSPKPSAALTDIFTDFDLHIFAVLEARIRTNKWLHLSADFANLTGRAVDSEIIRQLFEGGEGGSK
ncbi:uncharacterized protein F4822DRAFT_427388 [Hypoxylon trugodes]|uniref:uncharacterized protein n=1 Tax=Hypoxylon trugodes TaxID=326681 RepID=UPI0021959C33|nr:uncharacterized protein F4822DRAFT_427388 [Hypoxylon trugodes]KAI1391535.1 hypothetical protein F4822DRAFT_427388 [Hypoxylon trugodes]